MLIPFYVSERGYSHSLYFLAIHCPYSLYFGSWLEKFISFKAVLLKYNFNFKNPSFLSITFISPPWDLLLKFSSRVKEDNYIVDGLMCNGNKLWKTLNDKYYYDNYNFGCLYIGHCGSLLRYILVIHHMIRIFLSLNLYLPQQRVSFLIVSLNSLLGFSSKASTSTLKFYF